MKLRLSVLAVSTAVLLSGCATTDQQSVGPPASQLGDNAAFARGRDCLAKGDIPGAVSALTEANMATLSDLGLNGSIRVWLGEAYLRAGRFSDAISQSRAAVEQMASMEEGRTVFLSLPFPPFALTGESPFPAMRVRAFEIMAAAQLGLGNRAEAVSALAQAIRETPLLPGSVSSGVFAALARLRLDTGEYEAAVTAANRALELKPDSVEALVALGRACGMTGQYGEAIRSLRRAAELDPESAEAWSWLGRLLWQQQAYGEAVPAFEAAMRARPSDPVIPSELAVLYNCLGRYNEAIATADAALARPSLSGGDHGGVRASLLAIRALANRSKGRLDAAVGDAEMANAMSPEDPMTQLALGAAYLDRGRYDESIAMLSRAGGAPAQILAATAHVRKGEQGIAEGIYIAIPENAFCPEDLSQSADRAALLREFKPAVQQHRAKARSLEARGRYGEALAELSTALKMADDTDTQAILETGLNIVRMNPWLPEVPRDAKEHARQSAAQLKEGDIEQAAVELAIAIREAPFAARLYYNSAVVNAELGNHPKAVRHMGLYLKAFPDAPDSPAARAMVAKFAPVAAPPPVQPPTPLSVVTAPDKNPAPAAAIVSPARPAVAESGSDTIFNPSQLDQIPVALSQPPPDYPDDMRRLGSSGDAVIVFVVDAGGGVRDPRVIRSSNRLFEAPALQAVAQWKFRPGSKDGRNVSARMSVDVLFQARH